MTENFWDEQEKKQVLKYDHVHAGTTAKEIRVAWGEHQLKKWFDRITTDMETLPKELNNLERLLKIKWVHGVQWTYLRGDAVDALGEKTCLELLGKWWGNK